MIDIKKLRELVKLMVSNDLTELDIESENERVALRRGGPEAPAPVYAAPPPVVPAPAAPGASSASAAGGEASKAQGDADDGLLTIDSPMVGTFYQSSSPDAPPFTKVGERIDAESVVCLIEAMKVFNEIKAECAGEVVKVLVESGQPVEFGQPMFKIKPD